MSPKLGKEAAQSTRSSPCVKGWKAVDIAFPHRHLRDPHSSGPTFYDTSAVTPRVVLLDRDAYGVYHVACHGSGSRADVARFLLECLGVGHQVRLREVDSSFFAESHFAFRPRSEQLIDTALKSTVELLAKGQVSAALESLQQQGHVK